MLEEYQNELSTPLLYSSPKAGAKIPWIVSEPFQFSLQQWDELEKIGVELSGFFAKCLKQIKNRAIMEKFKNSFPENDRAGVERMEKSRQRFPIVARPDLIIDEHGKFQLIEAELQIGGLGILQRMQEVYGQQPTIAEVWTETIGDDFILSIPEWKPFVSEQRYFAEKVGARFVPIEKWNTLSEYQGLIYRNCCTLNLLTKDYPAFIPDKAEITPSLFLDWKGWMSMAHSLPALEKMPLTRRIPESHLLPLESLEKRKELLDLSKKQRKEWVLKPVHSWGSKDFYQGEQLNANRWNQMVLGLPDRSISQGMLLQKRVNSALYKKVGLTPDGKLLELDKLRIRVNPFYLFWHGASILTGVAVTLRKSVKVHGATDSVMTIGTISP